MSVIELKDSAVLCMKHTMCDVALTKADDPKSPIIARVSTESTDSDGDVVHQGRTKKGAGWLVDRFNAGPVMVWSHDLWMPNLSGPSTKAIVQRDEKFGRSLFINPMEFDAGDDFAMHIEGKIRRKVLKEFSVSFIGKIWELLRDKENDRVTGREFFEHELIEVSPVNRGANPDTDAVAKRLLGSAYVLKQIEDSGDTEVIEAREELYELHEKLAILESAMKTMGDQVSACAEALDMIKVQAQKRVTAYDSVATDMLKSLSRIGTAHD